MSVLPAGLAPWLAQTKFYPPAPREDLVARPRLDAALTGATAAARLTLVTAPAGYGKTTLVAGWLMAQPQPAGAWLTLDEGDNDTGRFLTALVAAFRRLHPGWGAGAAMLAEQSGPGLDGRTVVGALINDILDTLDTTAVLVLDDLQTITAPDVYLALDYLLEHLPPQLRLIALTRQDPPLALARLRARGQLAELRLAALRFTAAETAVFLNDRLRLGLAPPQLAALQERTEGWPAGLRLLAGSLESGAANPAAFVRAVSQADGYLFDFLAEEVLRHQAPEVRTFLLETAILPTLTPALCTAVTGRADAGALLTMLARRNLFLNPVAGPPGAYQYHALFADFLRRLLAQEQPARLADLHRRAAAAEDAPGPAIAHYLAADLWEPAAARIAAAGEAALAQGWGDTVRGWLLALPEHVRGARPRLGFLLGLCEWHRGALPAASALFEAALPGLTAAGDQEAEGQCLGYLALHAALQYRFAPALAYLAAALARPLPPPLRAHLLLEQAHALLISRQRAAAQAALAAALALGQESRDPAVLAAILRHYHPPFGVLPGAFPQLDAICTLVQQQHPDLAGPLGVSLARHRITLHLCRGEIAAAIRLGEATLAQAQPAGPNFQVQMVINTSLAQAYLIAGQPARAADLLGELTAGLAGLEAHPAIYMVLLYLWGRACCAAGQLDQARALLARLRAAPAGILEMRATQELLGGLVAWAQGDHAGAEALLARVAAVEDDLLTLALSTSPRLLLAALYLERDRPAEALRTLAQVLAGYATAGGPGYLMREGGRVIPVLRLAMAAGVEGAIAAQVLTLLGAAPVAPPPSAGRPHPAPAGAADAVGLSPREREVLQLLATGIGNRAIAARLVIGEQTVKTHLINVFRKLGVTTRTAAVQRARDLGLL